MRPIVDNPAAILRNGVFVTADETYCRKTAARGGAVLIREFAAA